ncbi:MAG: hypothetical protein IJI96_03330 [Methanobrevibacter sp.]|nr:hypothetical protein [Methanobrevibacter sp.]
MNITEKDIDANKPVIVKWAKTLQSNGVATAGVMAGQATEFLTRMEDESELLAQLRYIEGEGETQDIQQLRVKANLMNMMKLSGASGAGTQIDSLSSVAETTPTILKDTLVAQPFTAYTYIPKTFLKTNIEKEGFISKYESLLVPSVAFSAEQIAIFGKNTQADAYGIHGLDGILYQLDAVATASVDTSTHDLKDGYPLGRYGYYDDTTSGHTPAWASINAGTGYDVIPQIDAMLQDFTSQGGKRKEANIYVSSKLEAILIAEASKRETDGGDRLFFNDVGNLVLRGREVIQLDALDNPVNSYGDCILIANPDSIAYYPVMNIESESAYVIEKKSYLTSVDVMFDVGIIFAEDVLYASVSYTPKN